MRSVHVASGHGDFAFSAGTEQAAAGRCGVGTDDCGDPRHPEALRHLTQSDAVHSGEQAELVSEVVLEALLGDRGDDELSGAEHGAYERRLLLLFYRPNRCGPCRVRTRSRRPGTRTYRPRPTGLIRNTCARSLMGERKGASIESRS
jgi:hypothetical protein